MVAKGFESRQYVEVADPLTSRSRDSRDVPCRKNLCFFANKLDFSFQRNHDLIKKSSVFNRDDVRQTLLPPPPNYLCLAQFEEA